MLELLIAACLSTAGTCRDFQLLYDPGQLPLTMCVSSGQAEIARWKETHPDWMVVRWRCSYRAPGTADL